MASSSGRWVRRMDVALAIPQLRQAAIASELRRADLFADCPAPALDCIAAQTTARTLRAGECLFCETKLASCFFIVQCGAIKLHHRATALGRERIIRIFRPYESLAEETLVSESHYAASACATEPSQVLAVPRQGFMEVLRRFPQLSLSLLNSLGRQFNLLVGRLDDLALKDVQTRLINWLLEHCPDPESNEPQTIRLAGTKQLLAAELGTCAETFSRTLARLRDRRWLSVEGKSVTLLCPFRLAQSVHGIDGTAPSVSPRSSYLAMSRKGLT